jgi:hypothetical protein
MKSIHIDKNFSILSGYRLTVGQATPPALSVGEDADPTKKLPQRGTLRWSGLIDFKAKSRTRRRSPHKKVCEISNIFVWWFRKKSSHRWKPVSSVFIIIWYYWIPAGVYSVLVGATLCGDPNWDTGPEWGSLAFCAFLRLIFVWIFDIGRLEEWRWLVIGG